MTASKKNGTLVDLTNQATRLAKALASADAVLVGAGAGLSTAAGLTYSGERFQALFPDFIARYGFSDMYSAGFHPFPSPEEKWAYWSRYVWHNRYVKAPKDTYESVLALVEGKEHFVLTTNVDHQFQLAGVDEQRFFATQGDFGLWQCSLPCHEATYDNREAIEAMVTSQRNMRIPSKLVPHCPRCGEEMAMNLRSDDTFVEDTTWHERAARYREFISRHSSGRLLLLELGVGGNTPVIVKYPFWRLTSVNPDATYACLNLGEAFAPAEIKERSILIDADIDRAVTLTLAELRAGMQG